MAASVWIASSMVAPFGSFTGRMELTMPRVIVPARPKGIADGIDLLAHLQVLRIAQHRRRQVGGLDLDDRQVVRAGRCRSPWRGTFSGCAW